MWTLPSAATRTAASLASRAGRNPLPAFGLEVFFHRSERGCQRGCIQVLQSDFVVYPMNTYVAWGERTSCEAYNGLCWVTIQGQVLLKPRTKHRLGAGLTLPERSTSMAMRMLKLLTRAKAIETTARATTSSLGRCVLGHCL
jgi:hypothetical protein